MLPLFFISSITICNNMYNIHIIIIIIIIIIIVIIIIINMYRNVRGGGHIDLSADPIGIGVGVTLSCLYNILRTSGLIFTKFSWIL